MCSLPCIISFKPVIMSFKVMKEFGFSEDDVDAVFEEVGPLAVDRLSKRSAFFMNFACSFPWARLFSRLSSVAGLKLSLGERRWRRPHHLRGVPHAHAQGETQGGRHQLWTNC